MKLSICSFSFHQLLSEGKQDIFQYIQTCKDLGCTHLHPWSAHFIKSVNHESVAALGQNPGAGSVEEQFEAPKDKGFLNDISEAAKDVGLLWEMIAVDRAYIYDEDPEVTKENRRRAIEWLDVAETIQCPAVRIDAGGTEELPDDMFKMIVEGYNDLIARAKDKGITIFMENHFGSSRNPDNVIRYLENIEGLHLLFDTNNFSGDKEEAWRKCAKYASALHVKTLKLDEEGNETTANLPLALKLLVQAGYDGIWGIESVIKDMDEIQGAEKTIKLIKKILAGLNNCRGSKS